MNQNKEGEGIVIECFRASDFPEKCIEYSNGRNQVLKDYGFMEDLNPDIKWHKNDYTIVALVYQKGEAVAGMRLDVNNGKVDLPVVDSLKNLLPALKDYLKLRANGKFAEGNGTWNAKKISGLNMSQILTRYLYAVALNLDVVTIFSFQARFARRIVENYGAVRVTEIGKDGWFSYPSDKYLAGIYLFEDIKVFNFKDTHYVDRIRFLANHLNCKDQKENESKEAILEYKIDERVLWVKDMY